MRHRGPLNGGLFERDGCFGRPTIWLSGNHDPFYDMQHRCDNFALFQRAGGLGAFRRSMCLVDMATPYLVPLRCG